jgi:hypothetical protein
VRERQECRSVATRGDHRQTGLRSDARRSRPGTGGLPDVFDAAVVSPRFASTARLDRAAGWNRYRIPWSPARPSPTRRGPPVRDGIAAVGCHASGCGPVSGPTTHTTSGHDQPDRDLSRTRAVHVTFPLINGLLARLGLATISPGGLGARASTTAGCVATGRDGLVRNGRAPKTGTAAPVTTEFGGDANPATRAGRAAEADASSTREASIAGRGPGVPSRERRAHKNAVCLDRTGAAGRASMIRTISCPWLPTRPWTTGTRDLSRQDPT